MWCPLSGKICETTGCSGLYKLCQGSLDTMSKNPDRTTREQQLEIRIKELELDNQNLRAQLFNLRAAAPPYKQY